MEITWIIEKYDNSEYFDSLEKSIAKYGQNCIITNILPDIDKNQCVICYGSLQFAYKCRKLAPWVPSLFYTKDNYNCNVYYSYLSKYLLNRDYLMLPVMEVFNRWEELNLPDRIFMRPNDGNKVFTGDVFTFDNRKEDISYLQQYALRDLDNIIGLVSSVKKIEREWRVIVNSDGIISYSLYLSNGEVKEQCSIDSGAVDVAMGVVKHLEFTPVIPIK